MARSNQSDERARSQRAGTGNGDRPAIGAGAADDRYKWIVLTNTTLGMMMATIDISIMLIALPDIFNGIGIDPLKPGNSFFLLWMILGFMVVTSVLVVSLGRLGDMYGRVKMYNLGFAVYTLFSLVLTLTWMHGTAAAIYLVVMRLFQGVGAAFLIANSSAILTDAFPPGQRGMALGVNQIAGISGTFIGLVLGGILAPIDWRLIFLVSVPVGLFGTIWAYTSLREVPRRAHAQLDWAGNITFSLGLVALMIAITYGIQPYGGSTMGWTSPLVDSCFGAAVALLVTFAYVETKVPDPMFRLNLFRIRAFTAGSLSSLLSSMGRGGLMFMLIIWLQGIWLPLHGYSFAKTPLWAGIYMLPLTGGFLLAGPVSGILSDRFGSRPFASGGMVAAAGSFALLELLPVNFPYWAFAVLLLTNGLAMGAFAAPNRAGVMNSLPPEHRGVGSGMNSTFQNSAQVLSIGIFFTLMIVGLSSTLPGALEHGLVAHGVPASAAAAVAKLPPVSILFAAFLGYSPIQHLLGSSVLAHLSAANVRALTGRSFFPHLITAPFRNGLHEAFDFAIAACLVAAGASWLRGGKYVYVERDKPERHHHHGNGASPAVQPAETEPVSIRIPAQASSDRATGEPGAVDDRHAPSAGGGRARARAERAPSHRNVRGNDTGA